MKNASTSRIDSINTRNNLTYIEEIIKIATEKGLFKVTVEGQFMDEDMANNLKMNFGYTVYKKPGLLDDQQSDFVSYVISW